MDEYTEASVRKTEASVLASHGIAGDPFANIGTLELPGYLVSLCCKCGSVVVAPDEISATAYALLADESEEWCCGYTVVYRRNPAHVQPSDAVGYRMILAWNRASAGIDSNE